MPDRVAGGFSPSAPTVPCVRVRTERFLRIGKDHRKMTTSNAGYGTGCQDRFTRSGAVRPLRRARLSILRAARACAPGDVLFVSFALSPYLALGLLVWMEHRSRVRSWLRMAFTTLFMPAVKRLVFVHRARCSARIPCSNPSRVSGYMRSPISSSTIWIEGM